MYKNEDLGDFTMFLEELISKDYEFVFFNELSSESHQVILRHDIDFDTDAALQTARIENKLGVKATYFFLMTNSSYNPFDKDNLKAIKEIKELGHKITIHFDPTIYDDFVQGFELEKQCFETMFNTEVDIVSLHRPNEYFQNYDKPICNCEHTYMDKYFRQIKYVADSGGTFRYGHPFNTDEFKNGKTLHILIHPIWWIFEGQTNHEILKDFYTKKKEQLKKHYAFNCKPFNEIRNELN
ncbi:hypothetical protein M3P19_09670 [Muricauda sp. 2012CJ35-5]|uniref:Polysaccharide deacetylase n=1 Tax=Flagellimonas spongiicola TaxID=2942208 RepID=A0ABT0PSD0_9FLAO|nr:hypothetical protein [Allomuricauda spongiicola]MCL6274278.1 hypothetical protein [Allomuricauda spongiicola]